MLFFSTHAAVERELVLVAKEVERRGGEAIFASAEAGGVRLTSLRDVPAARAAGGAADAGFPRGRSAVGALAAAARARRPGYWLELARLSRQVDHWTKQAEQVLVETTPCAVATGGDRGAGFEIPLVAAAFRVAVPTVVVPFAVSDPQGGVRIRRGNPLYRAGGRSASGPNCRIARSFPGQAWGTDDDSYLFFSAAQTQVYANRSMLPPNPWWLGGGLSTVVAVAGQADAAAARRGGVDPEKIAVTGQPSHDVLYRSNVDRAQTRADITRRLELDSDRPLVVCAVPHLAEHGLASRSRHDEEIEFLLSHLALEPANVVLSLHPKSDRRNYERAAARFGARIVQEPLSSMLPAADVFVATFSSTVRWALLCGVPALVVDFYDLGYDIFSHYEGVELVNRREMFASAYRGLLAMGDGWTRLHKGAVRDALAIAPFDGMACRRIADLLCV